MRVERCRVDPHARARAPHAVLGHACELAEPARALLARSEDPLPLLEMLGPLAAYPRGDVHDRRARRDLRERSRHLRGARIASLRRGRHRAHDDRLEEVDLSPPLGGDPLAPGLQCLRRRQRGTERHRADELGIPLPVVEAAIDDELPEQDADGVEVGGAPDRLDSKLLRRHVGELALEEALARVVNARPRLRDAEVEKASVAVDAHEDVLGRHVTMDDPERLAHLVRRFVRRMETGEHARDDREHDLHRDRRVRSEGALVQVAERHTVHVLLDEDDLISVEDHVEHGNDVGMVDPRGDARLVVEHRDELRVVDVLRMEPLRCDEPRDPLGRDEPRRVHRRHPSPRDRLVQHVATDDRRLHVLGECALVHRGTSESASKRAGLVRMEASSSTATASARASPERPRRSRSRKQPPPPIHSRARVAPTLSASHPPCAGRSSSGCARGLAGGPPQRAVRAPSLDGKSKQVGQARGVRTKMSATGSDTRSMKSTPSR